MLARRSFAPTLHRFEVMLLEDILDLVTLEHPASIDPRTEIGRHGHVRRGRDDTLGKPGLRACDFLEDQSKALLGGHRPFDGWQWQLADLDRFRGKTTMALGIERNAREPPLELAAIAIEPRGPRPFLAVENVVGIFEGSHLLGRHQTGMIVLVS